MLGRKFASKVLTLESIGKHIKDAEYAVRGDVLAKASDIELAMFKGKEYPFQELTACNIGNPHFLGQRPLTWIRQGLSLTTYPDLLGLENLNDLYPQDIVDTAKDILRHVKGGVGAYSESQGLNVIRNKVARYINRRDGTDDHKIDNIFLSAGASQAVESAMSVLISSPSDGVMIPIPQYPLYNALITLKSGVPVGYFMEESSDMYWKLDIQEMQNSLNKARGQGVNVKSLVVINPGNPTGQVLSLDNLKRIVEFAEANRLVILADEVYQDNIYSETKKFHSFRKVVKDLNLETELFSFHSLSKGFYGECGLRGGYMELNNIDRAVQAQLLKLASIVLCPTTLGQIAIGLALDPPQPGSPSFATFNAERNAILGSLKRKALIMHEMLNTMDNIKCNYVEGAMYAMPLVSFTKKAWEVARQQKMHPDKLYALEAVEATGIIIVPGSGFGQQEGTGHFRITILSPEDKIRETLARFKEFNNAFHQKYKD